MSATLRGLCCCGCCGEVAICNVPDTGGTVHPIVLDADVTLAGTIGSGSSADLIVLDEEDTPITGTIGSACTRLSYGAVGNLLDEDIGGDTRVATFTVNYAPNETNPASRLVHILLRCALDDADEPQARDLDGSLHLTIRIEEGRRPCVVNAYAVIYGAIQGFGGHIVGTDDAPTIDITYSRECPTAIEVDFSVAGTAYNPSAYSWTAASFIGTLLIEIPVTACSSESVTDSCGEEDVGACCVDGGCIELTEADCDEYPGIWRAGESCTGSFVCTGACCVDGECSIETQAHCEDDLLGTWYDTPPHLDPCGSLGTCQPDPGCCDDASCNQCFVYDAGSGRNAEIKVTIAADRYGNVSGSCAFIESLFEENTDTDTIFGTDCTYQISGSATLREGESPNLPCSVTFSSCDPGGPVPGPHIVISCAGSVTRHAMSCAGGVFATTRADFNMTCPGGGAIWRSILIGVEVSIEEAYPCREGI